MSAVMAWRARGLMARIAPLLPRDGSILDVGCGTGHNGERLRHLGLGPVAEVDVVNFKVAGPPPTLFDGCTLPFADGCFDAVTLVYVLHYARAPGVLLKEAQRVCRGPVIIVQTVCAGLSGTAFHSLNEFASRVGFCAARAVRAIGHVPCPLRLRWRFSCYDLLRTARQAGLVPTQIRAERHFPLLPLTRMICRFEPFKPAEG
jgi:SAM-dependent methyltransferase